MNRQIELGLEPGVLAVAAGKSTNVVVEVPARQLRRCARISSRRRTEVARRT